MTQSKLPKTWHEWNTLMNALLVLPEPLTDQSVRKCIVSFGYDPDPAEEAVMEMIEIIQRAFNGVVDGTD